MNLLQTIEQQMINHWIYNQNPPNEIELNANACHELRCRYGLRDSVLGMRVKRSPDNIDYCKVR